MKRNRIIGIFLCAVICAGTLIGALCSGVSAASVSFDEVVNAASDIIRSNEGSYASVNPNDNGALSVGWLQWHGNRALSLIKSIVSADTAKAKTLLGDTLYKEVTTATNWSARILTADEKSKISALMDTSAGHTEQDKLAYSDISVYINHGMTLGITDPSALVFFADIENQCGSGGSARVASSAISAAGSAEKVTLTVLYNASLNDSVAGKYKTRRDKTYNSCLLLGWDSLSGSFETWTADSSVNVRTGPDTAYERLTTLTSGAKIAVIAKKSIDGYCWGKTHIGWLCLDYCSWNSGSLPAQLLLDANGGDIPFAPIWTDVKLNTTRTSNTIVVYNSDYGASNVSTNAYGRETTVSSSGKVTADPNYGVCKSAIPSGGLVISGHGTGADWLYKNIKAGSYVFFDSELCRIYAVPDADSYGAMGHTVTYNKAYGSLPSAIRAGYSFEGWYTEAVGGTRVNSTTLCDTHSSVVLYAHWKEGESSSITYDTAGGSFKDVVSASLSGINIPRGAESLVVYNSSGDYTKAPTNEYGAELTVDASGKVITTPAMGVCGTAIPADGFILSGHNSMGRWLCSNVSAGDYVTYNADAKIVTVYKTKSAYDALNKQIKVGTPIGTLPEVTREYYTFLGWYTDDGRLATEKTVMNTAGMVLTARWEVTPTKLYCDADGGTIRGAVATAALSGTNVARGSNMLVMYTSGSSKTNIYGTEAVIDKNGTVAKVFSYGFGNSPVPSGGYVLSGHGTAGSWISANLKEGMRVKISGNTVAVYDSEANMTWSGSKTVKYGNAYGELPTAYKAGYTFLGWADKSGKTVTSSDIIDIYGDITLTAVWQKNCTVIFDTAGGTLTVPTASVKINGINTSRSTNTVIVYTGIDSGGTNAYGIEAAVDKSGLVTSVKYAGNTKIPEGGYVISGHGTMSAWISANIKAGNYVYWNGSTVTVYKNAADFMLRQKTVTLPAGSSLSALGAILPTASKADATFTAWMSGSSVFTADTAVSENITVTAKWKNSKNTAIFDTGEGSLNGILAQATLSGTNIGRSTNCLVIYKNKSSTGTNMYGNEAIIDESGCVAAVIYGKGNNTIPAGCWALSGHGNMGNWIKNNLRPGMYVSVSGNLISVYESPADRLANTGSFILETGKPYGTLPNARRSGYVLTGWQTATGEPVTADTVVADCDDPVLCAVWTPAVSITFDCGDGSLGALSSSSVNGVNTGRSTNTLILYAGKATTGTNEYGAEAIISYDGTVQSVYSYGGNHAIPEGCYVLSGHGTAASWIKANLKVGRFVLINGSSVSVYESKATYEATGAKSLAAARWHPVGSLPVPAKAGAAFDGWYTSDGIQLTADSALTESTTVYARYK